MVLQGTRTNINITPHAPDESLVTRGARSHREYLSQNTLGCQPVLGGPANNGAAGKAPNKALFAPFSMRSAALPPHHRLMRDSVAAGPCQGLAVSAARALLGLKNNFF